MDPYAFIAEQRIAQAMQERDLNSPKWKNKPLPQDDDGFVPAELKMAYKILKNSGFLPPEIEDRKEIQRLEDMIASTEDEHERLRQMKKLNVLLMKGDAVRDLPMFTKPVALLLGLGAVLIPVAPMYLYWTTQSAEAVQGLQGRYFIPMLAFVACWVAWRAASVRFAVALFSFLVLLVINVTAIYHLVARYYG